MNGTHCYVQHIMLILQWFPLSQFSLMQPLPVNEKLPQTHLCTTFILELLNALFGQILAKFTKFISAPFLSLVVWQMFISDPPNVHFVYNKYKVLLFPSVQSNILKSVFNPIEISGQGHNDNVIFLTTWHYGEDLKSRICWSGIV